MMLPVMRIAPPNQRLPHIENQRAIKARFLKRSAILIHPVASLLFRLKFRFSMRDLWRTLFCRAEKSGVVVVGRIFILIFLFFCESAMSQGDSTAYPLIYDYGSCTWQENGDNSITVSVDIFYKKGLPEFMDRAIMLWAYDSDGMPHPLGSPSFPVSVQADGVEAVVKRRNQYGIPTMDYVMIWGVDGPWKNAAASTLHVTATFSGSARQAVSVLAADMFIAGVMKGYWGMYEQMGAAYLYPGVQGGGCPVVPPDHPPKPPGPSLTLVANVPDWNLGELPPQHGEKRFAAMSDQLCFGYTDPKLVGFDLVIDADSQNGVVGGQYQLRNLDDPTQVVPYSLALNSGSSTVLLPNSAKAGIRLNATNPTCFSPTFKTFVMPQLKPGNYSDVLTFTVVTKT
ncbi:hypothetical protein [Burkholderia plantarii]|uniref:hypothetical protein n=1 Tax=Burkholderia plantarii TaxID=41899 RepID=UPI00272B1CAE|nr:hypothetical protein [Burkholderia plantarii]